MAGVKAVVTGVDTYRWVDGDSVKTADRGEEITVSQEEFDRVPGALSKPGDAGSSTGGFPTVHEALDALATANDFNFPQHVRTVPEKVKALLDAGIDPDSGPSASDLGYPSKQADLDKLAAANDFTWPEGVTKVADKQAALQSAGIAPSSD
jgi:hypothetical protein